MPVLKGANGGCELLPLFQVFENGVWVQEVGRAYRSRVQSVAMRLGRQYVNAKGTPTAIAASAASHDVGQTHRGAHAAQVPSPERHLRAVPSTVAMRTMYRPEPSEQHLKGVADINARLEVMRPARAPNPSPAGLPAIAGSVSTMDTDETASRRDGVDSPAAIDTTRHERKRGRDAKLSGPGGVVAAARSPSTLPPARADSLELLRGSR